MCAQNQDTNYYKDISIRTIYHVVATAGFSQQLLR
jgi:hypothetical protein